MALSVNIVLAGIDPGIETYSYGATLQNSTGVTAEGFIYRLDQMTPEDIVAVHTGATPGYYPESEIGWIGDIFNPLNVWWFGSSTNPGDSASFSFVSSKPVVGGYAEWLENNNGLLIPLSPGFEIVPAEFKVVDGRRGLRQLKMTLVNSSEKIRWALRRINTSKEAISLKDLAVYDRLHLSGKQLDRTPKAIYPGESLAHVDTLDKNIAAYILAYQLFEDNTGKPGRLIGTFTNSINLSRVKK